MAAAQGSMEESDTDKKVSKAEDSHEIKPGSTLQLPVEVYDKNSAIVLEFSEVKGVEVIFSIAFNESVVNGTGGDADKPSGQESPSSQVVEQSQGLDQKAKPQQNETGERSPTFMVYGPTAHSFGLFVVSFESSGVAEFIWDNSSSFWRGKTVKYTVSAYPSEAEAAAAVDATRTKYRKVKRGFQLLAALKKERDIEQKELASITAAQEKRQNANKTRASKIGALESRATALTAEQVELSKKLSAAEKVLAGFEGIEATPAPAPAPVVETGEEVPVLEAEAEAAPLVEIESEAETRAPEATATANPNSPKKKNAKKKKKKNAEK